MSNPAPRRDDSIARHVRPLPSAPSLAFERKEAKALLKQIRAGGADALRRVQAAHPVALRDRGHDDVKLADAQHVIAREYGFTSWPRMVEFFEELERHRTSPRYNSPNETPEQFERMAQSIVRRQQSGDLIVAREIAHYVPRFFARPVPDVLETPITMDEARLVVARQHRRVSWEELLERASDSRARMKQSVWEGTNTPLARARSAIRAADVDALSALLDTHPELLTPSVIDREWRQTLGRMALDFELESKSDDARRITELVASRGVDVQRELNERLLGWPTDRGRPDAVRWYLDRGADPTWLPDNGITILEHALGRYRSGACVDLIAERVTPRDALWVAAGIGDVEALRRFIARKGTLTAHARLNRPDRLAMGWVGAAQPRHDADDLEIMWEAFEIAGWNERWATMDALLDAGLAVDHAPLGIPLIAEAVGNLLVPLAEYLVSRGADLDREWGAPVNGSMRSFPRSFIGHLHDPHDGDRARRLLAVCHAGTMEQIDAEIDAKRQSPPAPESRARRAMQLAADDAARQGQSAVTTENMLVGLLRVEDGLFASIFMGTGTDMPKLRAVIGNRLLPDANPLLGQDLPADPIAESALRSATEEADARRREHVAVHHLLKGILSQDSGPGARLLTEIGPAGADRWEWFDKTL